MARKSWGNSKTWSSEGGGGTTDYDNLDHKPSINGVTLNSGLSMGDIENRAADDTTGKLGYKILQPNASFASQVTAENTIYEIRDVFDLGGNEVTIPAGCTLKFNGGLLKNGTAKGTQTSIDADVVKIFDLTLSLSGSWNEDELYPEQYGYYSGQDLNTYTSKIYETFKGVVFKKNTNYYVDEPLYIRGFFNAPRTYFYLRNNGVLITDASTGVLQNNYGLHNVTIDIYRISAETNQGANQIDYGLILKNLNSSEVKVKRIQQCIKGGILLHGDGQGVAYNRIFGGWINYCNQSCIRAKVTNSGWVNANYFYNFRLSASSDYPNCQAMIWEMPDPTTRTYYGNVFSQFTVEGFKANPLMSVSNFNANTFYDLDGDGLTYWNIQGTNSKQNKIIQPKSHITSVFKTNIGVVETSSTLCKNLIFDSGYLNETLYHYLYNSNADKHIYVDKRRIIQCYDYQNYSYRVVYAIVDNVNKKITQDFISGAYAIGVTLDTSVDKIFGVIVSEKHTLDIRYTKVGNEAGTDANNQSAGAPIVSRGYCTWSNDYKRYRVDSGYVSGNTPVEITVPENVNEIRVMFLIGSSTPSISNFKVFAAGNSMRIVPYQADLTSGPTANRPSYAYDGQTYFDTDLNKMIVALNSVWVNLDGTALS